MSNNIKALRSGVWYIVANVIMKGIVFFTTPIFTRILSKDDYGLYSNYSSWLSTFTVFVTLYLVASLVSARFDFEKDIDCYISSMLILSTISVGLWTIIVNVFSHYFTSLIGMDLKYINLMMVYMLLSTAIELFVLREQYFYGYKKSVITSLIVAVSTAILSVILVVYLQDKLFGRIAGSAIPTIVIGVAIYIHLLIKGKKVNTDYWKYALPICFPYIPHVLSLTLLNSMDKIMITKTCGADENAVYSVAYSCGAIVTLLVTSLNTAFCPWLGEMINTKSYAAIKSVSRVYILFFVYVASGIMLVTPEVLLIMGGNGYTASIRVMLPITLSCVVQFLYILFVNVEQFSKKTFGMACATVIAALSNYVLNSFFIPRFGYTAAAYTTLISYVILLILHMLLVKHIGLIEVYPVKLILVVLLIMSIYTLLLNMILTNLVARLVLIGIYALISLAGIVRHKDIIWVMIKRYKSKA